LSPTPATSPDVKALDPQSSWSISIPDKLKRLKKTKKRTLKPLNQKLKETAKWITPLVCYAAQTYKQ
jgi:hypothetical protein